MLVSGNNITINCKGTVLKSWSGGTGIKIENSENVTVKSCRFVSYDTAFYARNSTRLLLVDNHLLGSKIGVKFVIVSESATYNHDVSLQEPFEMIESSRNILSLSNKKAEGRFCGENFCNEDKNTISLFILPKTTKEDFQKTIELSITGKSKAALKSLILNGIR